LVSLLVLVASMLPRSHASGENDESANRGSFALEVGVGSVVREEATSSSTAFGVQLGQNVFEALGLIVSFVGTTESDDPDAGRSVYGALSLGVRWMPFEPRKSAVRPGLLSPYRYFDVAALHLEGGIGVQLQERIVGTRSDYSVSPTAGFVIGWLPMQGEDYAFGVEARIDVAYHGATRGHIALFAKVEVRH
jgi:hypothetical protein